MIRILVCTIALENTQHFFIIEMQIEASQAKISELEEQIRHQPMSSKDAQELHQNIDDAEDMLNKNRSMQQDSGQRVSELQMQHNRYVLCVLHVRAILTQP